MQPAVFALALLAWVGAPATYPEALARDQIRIVGSSTVYPFSTVVAENFGRGGKFKTPVVESTGTGGGLKLFCGGLGEGHPDMANASRRIKESEVAECAKNGITEITEVKIGFDGIVIANAKGAHLFDISLHDLFLALAKDVPQEGKMVPNKAKSWKEINPALPDQPIRVYGPPPTSGTRDAFVELAMEGGCKSFPEIAALAKSDEKRFKATCHGIREDGAYIEAGENDNMIVQKLGTDKNALGVFGFSFLDQNRDKVQPSRVNGKEATFDNILGGQYPVSRSLYFYVKSQHAKLVPGIVEYLREFTAEKAWSEDGYLADRGLIPMTPEERKKVAADVVKLTPMSLSK
ncbi:MAG: PstS family phosphate ABC transporter substrate-binding protein [Magnetococcales bacterium]|nr:PstS family phosphate ABC transporter substrate-binding protein [Magnetococcales bacterium]